MKSFFLIIALFLFLFGSAQNQGNIWYFGTHAGLDFNTGSPVYLEDGMLDTFEGTASMCNSDGELLFYTDGVTVYSANHNIMYNGFGLMGNSHTTQSALIIPFPGTNAQYLVFTLDYAYSNGTFSYSIVDMTQNNGLGAVTAKNVFIQEGCTEKMSAVFHENQQDIWVIIHERDNNVFKSYLITSAGFINNPVVSTTGPAINGPQGSLKASPDGSLLAMATYHQKRAEIYHFDKATGMVSYNQGFSYPDATYGVEFSGDNSKLYVNVSYDIKQIYQIDLSVYTNILIATPVMAPGAMQLGPDGKIYVALYDRPNIGSSNLGVINSPELTGTACNYADAAISLGSGLSKVGLPTLLHYAQNLVNAYFFADAGCSNEAVTFTDLSSTASGYIQQWIWNFGDGSAVDTINFPNNPNVQHLFSYPGTYNVSLTAINNQGYINTRTQVVATTPVPEANFVYSANCANQAVVFSDLSSPNGVSDIVAWNWNFGDPASGVNNTSLLSDPTHFYSVADTFNVSLIVTSLSGCTDTIVKQVISNVLSLDFTYSTACMREIIHFSPDTMVMNPGSIATWYWDFGDGSTSALPKPDHMYNESGLYAVVLSVTDTLGCFNTVTHIIPVGSVPAALCTFTTTSCTHSPVQFTDLTHIGNGMTSSWLWDFGDGQISLEQNPTHIYVNEGNYLVCLTVQNECGEDTYCDRIDVFKPLVSSFTYNYQGNFAVQFENLALSAESVLWDFGDGQTSNQINPVHIYSEAGNYLVCLTVSNACNTASSCEYVYIQLYSGIQDPLSESGIMLFPNPAHNEVFIEASNYKVYKVEIFTSQGIHTDTFIPGHFQTSYRISLKGKTSGNYTLRLLTDKGCITRSLIIQ
ncbi:MAG: PKD domain-containing protein [Bacteroidales bacterium]|nr:PKD domain-containing protein [Bacteroidales bacterium]